MAVASGLLALVVGGAFAVLLVAINDVRKADGLSRHSQLVLAAAGRLERLVIDLETGQRGFLLTGEEPFLEPWKVALALIPAASSELQLLTAIPAQNDRAREITAAIGSYIQDYSVPLVDAARRNEAAARGAASIDEGKRRVDGIRAGFDGLVVAELGLATSRQDRSQTAVRRALIAASAGLAGSVLLILVFTRYLTRAIVRPVRHAAAMAGQLAGGDLAVRMPETGIAEIGVLERSFNTMGGALEESRDELRRRAEEQGALRRIATLVARGVPPPEVFSAVAAEVGALLGAQSTRVMRYEADHSATVIASRSEPGAEIEVGERFTLEGENVAAAVLRTGRPARMSSFEGADGSIAAVLRRLGISATVGAPISVEGRLWGVVIAGWTTEPEPDQSAGTVARLAEFTELVATAIANADSQAELSASRARIVAAADETRRRIERDLHDGTQQRLVSLGLELRAAEATVPSELRELRGQLSHATMGLAGAVQDLQEISRGIHPAILSKGGLAPAVRTLVRRSPLPVDLQVTGDRRVPAPVEVAAYYVVSEALTNAAKHAQASVVDVNVEVQDAAVRLWIRDDGVGGADPREGSGLVGLRDRVEALGGRIEITSPRGGGTTVLVTIPIKVADRR